MIWLALGFLGFGVADLVRWSPGLVSRGRTTAALVAGVAATAVLAALSGMTIAEVGVVAALSTAVLAVWFALPDARPGLPLAWIVATVTVLFATSGAAEPVGGELDAWYAGLAFPFVDSIEVEQFVLGVAATLFLLATANRIVRLVLSAAGTPAETGETALRGGRLLGPLERIVVGAIVVSGDPAGAALVVAAKGLLRFPEIRADAGQPDQTTEYFLIGTLTSLLMAGLAAIVVLASG